MKQLCNSIIKSISKATTYVPTKNDMHIFAGFADIKDITQYSGGWILMFQRNKLTPSPG